MQMSKLKLGLLIGAPVLLILILVGGYFIYNAIIAHQEENRKKVEDFGEMVIPADIQSVGSSTDPSLNPSIGDRNLTPTQRVIATLKEERLKLMEDGLRMREEIMDLKAQVNELQSYKTTNERYAPHTFNEEVSNVHTRVKQLLATQEESKRFTSTQLKGMAAASAKEYRRYLTMHKLVLDQDEIDTIVNDHLPVYAYCIGDGIEIAANSRSEELMIVEYFKTDKTDLMSSRLKSDVNAVVEPCQQLFAKRMTALQK